MKNEILNFLQTHWPEISVLVYEIIARLIPTSKNLSLIDLVLKLTGKTLELTQKGVDKVVPNNQKNTIKSFLVFVLLSLSVGANAQLNLRAKTLFLTDNVAAKDTTTNADDGQLYFNDVTQTLRLHKNGAWTTLSAGTITGLTSAVNGLNVMGTNAELGGPLIRNTTVSGAFQLDFTNNRVAYDDQNLSIHNPARTFHYTFRTGAIAANRQITLPLLTANETMVTDAFGLTLTNKTLGSGTVHSVSPTINPGVIFNFPGNGVRINNPANTFYYEITPSAITGNRILTIPQITGAAFFMTTPSAAANLIPYSSGSGIFTTNAGFGFNGTTFTTPNVSSSGRGTFTPSATLPGLNIGTIASDPSAPVNGDFWYQSTNNYLGTRINSVTHLIPTFNNTSFGFGLGSAVSGGTQRFISAVGSNANISLILTAKGSEGTYFSNSSFAQYFHVTHDGTQTNLTANSNIPIVLKPGNGSGADGPDLTLLGGSTSGAFSGGDIILSPGSGGTVKKGSIKIDDGADDSMGESTLVAGTITVNNTKITANTRVFLTVQTPGGTQGFLSVSRVAGTSFTITSTSVTETSSVAWLLIEPN